MPELNLFKNEIFTEVLAESNGKEDGPRQPRRLEDPLSLPSLTEAVSLTFWYPQPHRLMSIRGQLVTVRERPFTILDRKESGGSEPLAGDDAGRTDR